MISEIDINKHNFSKIGKYISNKLHHIHKPATAKQSFTISHHKTDRNLRPKPGEDSSSHKLRKKEHINRNQHDFSPPVGTYRVNYTAIDKYHLQHLETSISTTSIDPHPISSDKSTKPIRSLHTSKNTLRDSPPNKKDLWNSIECQVGRKSKALLEKMQKILTNLGFKPTDFRHSSKTLEEQLAFSG